MILKKGSKGQDVTLAQRALLAAGYEAPQNGAFDNETVKWVKAFQAARVDRDGAPLEVDGVLGDLTRWALENPRPQAAPVLLTVDYGAMPGVELGGTAVGRGALWAAIGEWAQGAGGFAGENRGPWIEKYLDGRAPEGSAWAAAFVSWCLRAGNGGESPIDYAVAARDILAQAKKAKATFAADGSKTPEPGDVVIWCKECPDAWRGHVGFVHHSANGKLYTIEGDKSAMVHGFSYSLARLAKQVVFCRFG